TESIRGLADACRALEVPVVGGNVSLYNESGGGPIYPTPVVGIVGELPDVTRAGRSGFASAGDAIGFAGPFRPSLAGSELAKLRGEALPTKLPAVDVAALRAAQRAILDAVRAGSLTSAHDVAEGGFLVAVAECCLAGAIGCSLDLGATDEVERTLFGESPGSGFVVSGSSDALAALGELVDLDVFGSVGGDALDVRSGDAHVIAALGELRDAHAALAPLFP
ncbi:MAG: AIR synthase-related protein, partial [Solirubrobacteraceae bacterium]